MRNNKSYRITAQSLKKVNRLLDGTYYQMYL